MNIKKILSLGSILIFLAFACEDKVVVAPGAPTLGKVEVSGIENFTAKLTSSIAKMGASDISQHGFVISTTKEGMKIDEKAIKKGSVERTTPTPIAFTETIKNLEPGKEYFVWSYATTDKGDAFSEATSFKTTEAVIPKVTTVSSEGITHNAAKLKGSITAKGTYPITEYGLVWATTANPTTAVTTKTSVKANITQFPAEFLADAKSLTTNTTYNFRAYVISNGVTSYGTNMTFKTTEILQPGVQTGNASDITVNSAKLSGVISSKGTTAITERGVVWGTAANPTTANSKASVAGDVSAFPNNFTVNAASLNLNTTYNYRAYVIMNGATTYGENKTFKTQDMSAPGIRTDDGPKVGENVATVWGTLTSKGSHAISEYGICWNTSANPTTANSKKSYTGDVSAFPRQFDALMQNLSPATTYHYRAYVIMNGVTTYGESKSFTTSVSEPRVTTGDIFTITGRGTVMSGIVNSQGSFPVTEIGIVYGPNSNPTTANTKLSKSGSGITFPHNFEFVERNGFSGTAAVYFRAYVISNGKTYYGASKVARAVPPTLQTGTSKLNGSVYTLEGSITTNPTYPIVEYGIVWVKSKTVVNPTTANSKISTSVPSTTLLLMPVKVSKTLNLSTIGNCQGVSFRVYCITSDGKTYYSTNVGSFGTSGCVN